MLYFDEAGYTGADLTNEKQPYFTLASVCLDDDDLEKIRSDIDCDKWGKELHFSSMYSNYPGRTLLEKIFSHSLLDERSVMLAFADKRYCIYAQIVDILIETFYYEQGVNIYRGAYNLAMANCMYYGAILHPNKELIKEYEISFVTMIRVKDEDSIEDFYRTTEKLRADKGTTEMLRELLCLVSQTYDTIEDTLEIAPFHMDLTVPLFSGMIQKWYAKTRNKYDVVFDSSEPFFANKDLLFSLRDMKNEETKVGYGRNKHIYPFPVGNIKIARSHEEFGIQLADLFASALNFVLTPRKDKFTAYQDALRLYPLFQSVEINIAPSTADFIERRMKDVKGIDPLNFICENITP
ncbi:MAG: DUF3800 domain-containing protein [Paludibacteraceae bacterium]|nr:DUF3800 domain-containing protein [Paludibacteraceae bacterium]